MTLFGFQKGRGTWSPSTFCEFWWTSGDRKKRKTKPPLLIWRIPWRCEKDAYPRLTSVLTKICTKICQKAVGRRQSISIIYMMGSLWLREKQFRTSTRSCWNTAKGDIDVTNVPELAILRPVWDEVGLCGLIGFFRSCHNYSQSCDCLKESCWTRFAPESDPPTWIVQSKKSNLNKLSFQ